MLERLKNDTKLKDNGNNGNANDNNSNNDHGDNDNRKKKERGKTRTKKCFVRDLERLGSQKQAVVILK